LPESGFRPEGDGGARNLPAVRPVHEIEPEVLDGLAVEDLPPTSEVPRVVRVVRVVVQHEHARAAGRNAAYVGLGVAVLARRLWDGRTTARYERFMRSAERSGDHQGALEWEARMAAFRRDRHQRRVDMIEVPARVLLQLPKILLGLVIVLAVLGILLAVASGSPRELAAPVEVLAHIAAIVALVVSVAWGPLVLAAPWLALAGLWWTGREHARATATGWLAPARPGDEDTGIVITADTIVLALQNLRIPELKRAFKEGWRPVFHLTPVKDGRGYSAVFSIPLGVTAEMIADQRPVLARNVHRAEVEVWPSDAEKAGTGPAGSVALWIADSGVLSRPAPEYPLMHEGTADVFDGVPGGVSPRGDEITVPVAGNNFVAGGQMGQGKSNACRVVMLGCALDPLAELDVFVFANNGDFDAYAPRLARYHKGVEDDTIRAAVNRLQELYDEVGRREGRLAELGAKKVTRGLAEQHPDLRPIVALFSECHELFGHPEFGPVAAELATKTAKRARKTAITLGFDTQSSRKEAIPPKLVELVSVNCCFYIKTWRSNDGFLGDGSFAAGIRATELRPGRDRGTSVITGVSDAQFELLRWYFVEVDDDTGYDAAAEVIARAVANIAPGTRLEASSPAAAVEARELLDDLAAVLGAERVRLADLPALLRDLAPTWGPYRTLTGVRLREQLDGAGVRTTNVGNVPRLDPADLRRMLAGRRAEAAREE
jgi:S-DNA-T family DNA segregation ATPase FtsK/SpoIIIE